MVLNDDTWQYSWQEACLHCCGGSHTAASEPWAAVAAPGVHGKPRGRFYCAMLCLTRIQTPARQHVSADTSGLAELRVRQAALFGGLGSRVSLVILGQQQGLNTCLAAQRPLGGMLQEPRSSPLPAPSACALARCPTGSCDRKMPAGEPAWCRQAGLLRGPTLRFEVSAPKHHVSMMLVRSLKPAL